ncbi:arsenate reductase (thioredoxin) [Calorimonas adulescens]|uniref:Arsenate reductase (Thioredoxin) n=2 Tax=Calorimonas adulescens TaxID=2606906 RepID=A0A5D8QBF5_9THEO|nr:arsenate reductase (thioredoxin) [Calorimonas adulescens]TZE81126.1 arsenate reductase (thioredoxin) [Calorimonas adulescens]
MLVPKKRIMFLCINNSCRSQMAEGIAKTLKGDEYEVFSAGMEPTHVNPRAIEVLKEIGIDISSQYSKLIENHLLNSMDIVVTLCGEAEEACPVTPPHIKREHWPLPDPARATGTEEEIMDKFREVRNKIIELVKEKL